MFKRIYIFCIAIFVFNVLHGQNELGRIQNLQGNGQIQYKTLQHSITKSTYNKFDRIYVDYPALEPNNPKIAIKLLNDFMYKKAFLDMQTEAFKYDFLPFAYGALASTLGKNYPDNYAYYSANMGIPTIHEIAPKILFLSGDIMCYQVLYEFYFEPNSNNKLEGFTFVKTYYLQVSTGKEISMANLFEPGQKKLLLDFLNKEINQIVGINSAYVSSFYWSQANELGGYAIDDDTYAETEGDENGEPIVSQKIYNVKNDLFKEQDLLHAFLNLNPFSAQIIIPPFCSSFDDAKQLGILITVPFEFFVKVMPKSSLLGNWFNIQSGISKLPKHINVLQKQQNHFTQLINPLMHQSNFVKGVSKGTKTQSLFIEEVMIGDSNKLRLQRTAQFDTLGRLVKLLFGENNNPENWSYFEYDKAGNLVSEINYAYNQIEEQKTFLYNAQNCLVQVQTSTGDELPSIMQYFYRDSFVYECPLIQVFSNMDNFKDRSVNVYALDAFGNIKSNYVLNQIPRYVSKFNQDKLMASYSLTHPNLDNAIYAYNADGMLETVIADNGRRIHHFIMKDKLLQSYAQYDSYQLQSQFNYEYDAKNNLTRFKEKGQYGNGERTYILKYDWYE